MSETCLICLAQEYLHHIYEFSNIYIIYSAWWRPKPLEIMSFWNLLRVLVSFPVIQLDSYRQSGLLIKGDATQKRLHFCIDSFDHNKDFLQKHSYINSTVSDILNRDQSIFFIHSFRSYFLDHKNEIVCISAIFHWHWLLLGIYVVR